jgi:hypothetical protein
MIKLVCLLSYDLIIQLLISTHFKSLTCVVGGNIEPYPSYIMVSNQTILVQRCPINSADARAQMRERRCESADATATNHSWRTPKPGPLGLGVVTSTGWDITNSPKSTSDSTRSTKMNVSFELTDP